MDAGMNGLLDSVTHKTLHAQNFSRASSQASHVLTDLLSRYMSLLATTCSQYAEHAGRASVSVHDAVLALDELGVSVDELTDYAEGEGRELTRYASNTARRAEELTLLKDSLAEGRRTERDDAIALVYGEIPISNDSTYEKDEQDDEDYDVETQMNGDIPMMNGHGKADARMTTPALPPSPISNPSSPSRKRKRLETWNPPSHIPDFLPPYPSISTDVSPPPSPSSQIKMETDVMLPPPTSVAERERLPAPPPQQLSTATSAADYLTPVPYSMSSLSAVPESHLSDRSILKSVLSGSGLALQLQKRKHEPPAIMPSLVTAYHHVLTRPPPQHPSSNPSRHHTLFANVAVPRPRVVAPAPTYPVSLATGKGKNGPAIMPASTSRTVMVPETVISLSHEPMSRIPEIARVILPLSVFNRATRVNPPPPLVNPASKEKFLYGMGMPAPWNANPLNQPLGVVLPGKDKGKNKGGKAGDGDEKEFKERDGGKKTDVLADATLFSTWDWETHDFRLPLPPHKRGRALGNLGLGAGDSGDAEGGLEIEPIRRNSKAGRN
ncbi:hypothetical protein EW145_g6474 [Phellinidium pouzarii]|uniref:Bromodomain associated domain-containing protein n=1 Tax=Phellinidium pouzarii TaxID=167371 RepID=A0A4S4KX17_9AGAM|nr:hypothetical protein EW145_g6474 [Phellinidium pouzarii]